MIIEITSSELRRIGLTSRDFNGLSPWRKRLAGRDILVRRPAAARDPRALTLCAINSPMADFSVRIDSP